MNSFRLVVCAVIAISGALPSFAQARQLTRQDYARAAKFLLDSTDPLVGHFTDPLVDHEVQHVTWLDATHFWFRDHDASGDQILEMNAKTGQVSPAFNQSKLAAALAKVGRKSIRANKWPAFGFSFHRKPHDIIDVRLGRKLYRCALSHSPVCTPRKYELPKHRGRDKSDAKALSPNGKFRIFMQNWNLWIRNAATGKAKPLTTDGVRNFGYGKRKDGAATVRWSPDSKKLVAFRIDERKVGYMYQVVTRVGHPTLKTQHYALPGDKNVFLVHPVVIDVAQRTVMHLRMPAEQQLYGWSRVQWGPQSKTFAFVSTSRNQKTERFRVANSTTGQVRTVFKYTAKDFYQGWYLWGGQPDWQYLPRRGVVVWPTEQNNWINLYLYSLKTGRMLHPITRGPGDVIQVAYVDRKTGILWYGGVGRTPGMNPYYRQLFKVNIFTGKTRLLTPEREDHITTVSPHGKYFVDSYSTPTVPPTTVLRKSSDGRVIGTVARTSISRLKAMGWVPPIPFTVKARDGKTTLYGLMYRPTNFNPHEKYPVIDFVYPGPQIGSIATFSFRSERGGHQALAELGFIVVTLDGMGTPFRSARFQKYWYGDMGDDTIPDQVTGIKQLAARYAWMNINRVGIWGHSGGGNATVSAMLHYPKFFKVGWAESGNYDNRDYSYTWGERWQGLLARHKNGTTSYDNQASELIAKNLQGHLMLVTGSIDNNVPPSNTYLMVNALMNANKDFSMLVVPNEHHHYGTHTPYVTRRCWDFFVKYLAGNTPPHEFNEMPKSLHK